MKRLMIAGLVVIASVALTAQACTPFHGAQGMAVAAIVASMMAEGKAKPPEGWRD